MLGLLGDKKKVISIILKDKPIQKDVPEGLESDVKPAMKAVAKELLGAIKAEDPEELSKSLQEFFYLCEKEEHYEEKEEKKEDLMEE